MAPESVSTPVPLPLIASTSLFAPLEVIVIGLATFTAPPPLLLIAGAVPAKSRPLPLMLICPVPELPKLKALSVNGLAMSFVAVYVCVPVALKVSWVAGDETGGTPPTQLAPTLQDPLFGLSQTCAEALCTRVTRPVAAARVAMVLALQPRARVERRSICRLQRE